MAGTAARGNERARCPVEMSGGEEVQGVYVISVAARILAMHPQTLRKYERMGLLSPVRTVGMLRLYSEEDIARLRLIKHLVGDLVLNLAGVQLALSIFNGLLYMKSQHGRPVRRGPESFRGPQSRRDAWLLHARLR